MKTEILFFSAPWCGPCSQMKSMLSESISNELNIRVNYHWDYFLSCIMCNTNCF
ncbi:MAG: thioredoxin [Flavobacteriia bacterium]|nr:thioredoxin [Flavobacteriia bacterium]